MSATGRPTYSLALENGRLTHQKSMPTLSPTKSFSHTPTKSSTLPTRRRFPTIDPPAEFPQTMQPLSSGPMIPLPSGDMISLNDILPLISTKTFSTPVHNYIEPTLSGPQPIFQNGRNRFPMRQLRWHSPSTSNPNRYEILPGTFVKEDYNARWNGGVRRIDDPFILTIQPECMYTGIHYRVDVNPSVWGNRILLRGDIITFRGFESDDIKYVVTWQRSPQICEGSAYIQLNAMGKDQYAVDSSDADWPTIGLYVPIHLNCVVSAPVPNIPYDPHAKVSFVDPFTAHVIPPDDQDGLIIPPIERRNALGNASPWNINRFTRKFSATIIKSADRRD